MANAALDRGLIGPREVPRLWTRHVLNCAVIEPEFALGATVCDIGSGAGLPGIVLALTRPDLSLVLVEPLLRRSEFLVEVVATLELDNVEVLRARAEDVDRQFDQVTARAVAPLSRLVGWALPLCRSGGALVAMKGESAADELTSAAPALRRLRAGPAQIIQYGQGVVSPPTTIVRIVSSGQRTSSRKGPS